MRRYLGKLHALYAEYAGETPQAEALFSDLRRRIQDPGAFNGFPDRAALPILKRIPLRMNRLADKENAAAALLMFMLYYGGISLRQAIETKFDSPLPPIQQLQNIADRQRAKRPKAQYLFPLEQGKHRPDRLSADVTTRLTELLSYFGYRAGGPVTPDTILGWWIDTAVAKGISLETVAAVVPAIPPTHRWLGIVNPAAVDDDKRIATLQKVADALNPHTAQWYALCLRGRTTPREVADLLKETNPALHNDVHFFYPTRTVYQKVGRRRVKKEEPYIPHILFIKTRHDNLLPLMNAIGALAWCYKTANRPDAPYSAISWSSMVNFQKFIGVLDPDTEIQFVKHTDLTAGMKVRITGGPAAGLEGEILRPAPVIGKAYDHPSAAASRSAAKQPHDPDAPADAASGAGADKRTFILRIANNVTLKWEATIPAHFLQPL